MTRSLDKARGILSPKSVSGGPLAGFRNKIINGDFDIWQRGTSFTAAGYGAMDRWRVDAYSGTTHSTSQQTFTFGQTDVLGSPTYFTRVVVTSGNTSTSYSRLQQKIEEVDTLHGKDVTVTFYAKADSAKNVTIEFEQSLGSGGSGTFRPTPSKHAVGTTWTKVQAVISLGSLAGQTLGTGSNLGFSIWLDAGSAFNSRTDSLGNQSGTFDIAHVSIVEGDATLEDDPFEVRHTTLEEIMCYRYYYETKHDMLNMITGSVTSGDTYYHGRKFPVEMRDTPSLTLSDHVASKMGTPTATNITPYGFRTDCVASSTDANAHFRFNYAADAEL
jgi:hypothetical protein